MDLPSALLRMLEGSCENDKLKNWSVYEEKDGCYTFKIRFIPNSDRHIGDISVHSPIQSSNVQCAFKRKNEKQINRDFERNKVYQEKRITRSQTAKNSVSTNAQEESKSSRTQINHGSPIEGVRHNSMLSDTPSGLNTSSPVFVPAAMEATTREIDDDSLSIPSRRESCSPPVFCLQCSIVSGYKKDIGPDYYFCRMCNIYVCFNCVEAGIHKDHRQQGHLRYIPETPS